MKKTLLMLVAFMATMTAFAQEEPEGWTKDFSPVAKQKDLGGVHTAVASDGAVYASSTYNQSFTIGDVTVADPEGLTSSCVLKFDKDGNAKWGVTLLGKCKVHTMTADTDGTLYIGGTSADEKVIVTGTDGKSYEIINPTKEEWGDIVVAGNCGFFARISPAGVVENLIQIDATGPEGTYYGEAYLRPRKMVLDNGLLYVACYYQGDVKSLNWQGRYVTYTDFETFETSYVGDIKSAGLFCVSALSLDGLGSVATVQATTDADLLMDGLQCAPEGFDFVIYGGVAHVSFFAWGEQTLKSVAGSQPLTFKMEGNGNNENALVFANVNAPKNPIIFHADPNSYGGAVYDLVDAAIAGENCILGGTFYGNFPLKPEITTDANTSFVASIKMADCSVNWATPNTVASEATCMIVTGEEIHASTDAATYTFKTATGEVKADKTRNQSYADADVYNDQFVSTVSIEDETVDEKTQEITKPAKVVVFSPKMSPSGIEAIKAAAVNGEAKIYNLNGQRVAAPQKGLYIVNGTKVVMK